LKLLINILINLIASLLAACVIAIAGSVWVGINELGSEVVLKILVAFIYVLLVSWTIYVCKAKRTTSLDPSTTVPKFGHGTRQFHFGLAIVLAPLTLIWIIIPLPSPPPAPHPLPDLDIICTKSDYTFDLQALNENGIKMAYKSSHASGFIMHLDQDIGLPMIKIPGGTYLMGSKDLENARPQHQVTIRTFYMSQHEITQAQWRKVANLPQVKIALPESPLAHEGDKMPVRHISWEEAGEFCERLSRAAGKTFRLPTEAEWEYACRAGTTTPYYFGMGITSKLVNYNGENSDGPVTVGSFLSNNFGLYDMHGNLWEWCQDLYHDNYEGAPVDGSPWLTGKVWISMRVIRGGSWMANDKASCRSDSRRPNPQQKRNPDVGFRVMTLEGCRMKLEMTLNVLMIGKSRARLHL